MKYFAMNKAVEMLKSYAADESGATAIEYALIAGLIGIGIIAGASSIAQDNDSLWNDMASKVEAV